MPTELDPAGLQKEARSFRTSFKTLVLSTASPDGVPDASYAPFVLDDSETAHVFISRLAQHTQNILANPQVSILFIGDEKSAKNPFNRQRLTLQCTARELPRTSPSSSEILDSFEQNFGKTVALLKGLGDFHLFRLEVSSGSYVRGFAQAYQIADASLKIVQQRRG